MASVVVLEAATILRLMESLITMLMASDMTQQAQFVVDQYQQLKVKHKPTASGSSTEPSGGSGVHSSPQGQKVKGPVPSEGHLPPKKRVLCSEDTASEMSNVQSEAVDDDASSEDEEERSNSGSQVSNPGMYNSI